MTPKIRVFVDTNIIFSFRRSYVRNNFSFSRTDFGLDQTIQLIISSHVVYELMDVSIRHHILRDDGQFTNMIETLHIGYWSGSGNHEEMLSLVNDPKDAQILADAKQLGCDYLLTKNHRDFKSKQIKELYNIALIVGLWEIKNQ